MLLPVAVETLYVRALLRLGMYGLWRQLVNFLSSQVPQSDPNSNENLSQALRNPRNLLYLPYRVVNTGSL